MTAEEKGKRTASWKTAKLIPHPKYQQAYPSNKTEKTFFTRPPSL